MLLAGVAGRAGRRGHGDRGTSPARVAVDYLFPATFRPGLMLRVETTVARIGTTSWTLRPADVRRRRDWSPAASACWSAYSYADEKPRPLDDDERAFWATYR